MDINISQGKYPINKTWNVERWALFPVSRGLTTDFVNSSALLEREVKSEVVRNLLCARAVEWEGEATCSQYQFRILLARQEIKSQIKRGFFWRN